MVSYVYNPKCSLANERGMVEKNEDYYLWCSIHQPDNRMRNGNKIVEFRFIGDEMAPTRHMVDGKYYTSKKKFRNETKARGCIEVGNETATLLKPRKRIELSKKERVEHIKHAIHTLKQKKR